MNPSTLETVSQNFKSELDKSNAGEKTSLSFIKHKLPKEHLVENGDIFQVLVIGGSQFKKAKVQKHSSHFMILERSEKSQTPYRTIDDFLQFIENEIDPNVEVVAINFAYPLTPVMEANRIDGVLLQGTKENTFTGLVGKQVGKTIEEYYKEKFQRTIHVAVANDTVCVLVAGYGEIPTDRLACGIVGTGINFAFFLDRTTLVNLEAANFNKFPSSDAGKFIDEHSTNPGSALIEKETAGAYLYKHFNYAVDEMHIAFPKISSTLELKNLAEQSIPNVSKLAYEILDYSASLVACEIGGIMKFKQHDMDFVVEGSLLWEPLYGNMLDAHLAKLVPEYTATFLKIRESSIVGGAHLVG